MMLEVGVKLACTTNLCKLKVGSDMIVRVNVLGSNLSQICVSWAVWASI